MSSPFLCLKRRTRYGAIEKVVFDVMVAAAHRRTGVLYPSTDHMGEHELQRFIAELLRPLVERYLASRGKRAHTGADTFIYWEEDAPVMRLAPDVYVLPGIDPNCAQSSWKLWEIGVVPSFALEVVSSDLQKDYEDAPALYAAMGAKEVVIFDPGATSRSAKRLRWQVYRRVARRGLVRVEVSQDDRVKSRALGCYLRVVGTGDSRRIRLGVGDSGNELFPTEAEAERTAKEQERAAKEQERAAKEQERAAKDAAEQEIVRLRAEIDRLRAKLMNR